MKKLMAIGEALIDFIPQQTEVGIAEVSGFSPAVGGAPANVCGAFAKLGGKTEMMTQLGQDPFADKILNEFALYGIGSSYIKRTEKANTSLAFVALKKDGNREFSFYRNPGADMLFSAEDIKEEWFSDGYALHFCSVSLGDFPMKKAHEQAISYAKNAGMLISFDPNIRKALWKSEEALYHAIWEFIPKSDILKLSDEELVFITGKTDIESALEDLFVGEVKLILYTKGAEGAQAFTKKNHVTTKGNKVKAVDTTGAGDAFIGSFLYQLFASDITSEQLSNVTEEQLSKWLSYSNKYCSKSVQKKGVISSYPTTKEMEEDL